MDPCKTVVIDNGSERIELTLELEGGKYAAMLRLNGVPCHLEAMEAGLFATSCGVDDDPDYSPKLDDQGHAFLLLPFSK